MNWSKAIRKLRNGVFQYLAPRPGSKKVLLIGGFQRSGTTILSDVFWDDWRVKSYREMRRVDRDGELRIPDIDTVETIVNVGHEHLTIIKPLVDSHLIPDLLDRLPNAKALWLYRSFRGVVQSNIRKFLFQNADTLFAHLTTDKAPHWISDGETPETRGLLSGFVEIGLSAQDKLALTWLARNRLYYDLGLDKRDDVILLKYDDIIQSPESGVEAIYRFLDMKTPRHNIGSRINTGSARKGRTDTFDPQVSKICTELEDRLDEMSLPI